MLISQMNLIIFLFSLNFCLGFDNILSSSESGSEEYQILAEVNKNITLPCWPKLFPNKSASVYWEKNGEQRRGERVLNDGSLFLANLTRSDTKLYICRTSESDLILTKVHLYVRGPPEPPTNITVETSMLDALVRWNQPINTIWQDEMGGVATAVTVRYRIAGTFSWEQLPNAIPSSQDHVHIHGLKPNCTYEFEVFAHNKYGNSLSSFTVSRTKPDFRDVELSYRLLQSSNEANPRAWLLSLIALLVVVNCIGIIGLVFYAKKNRFLPRRNVDDAESIELVPNIIENPSYHKEEELQVLRADLNAKRPTNYALHSHSQFV